MVLGLVIGAQMLGDFAEFDQAELLSPVRCPVSIIHGDGDDEERQLLENSRRGLCYLPVGSRLEVIPGADHSFMDQLDRVIALGVSWLRKYLP